MGKKSKFNKKYIFPIDPDELDTTLLSSLELNLINRNKRGQRTTKNKE